MEGATAKTSTAPEQTQTAALTNRQNSRPLPIEGSKLLLSAEPGSARQSLLLWHKVRFCSATGLRLGASRALLRAERREAHFPRYGAAPVAAAVAPRPRETDLRLVHSSRWRRAAPCCFRVKGAVLRQPAAGSRAGVFDVPRCAARENGLYDTAGEGDADATRCDAVCPVPPCSYRRLGPTLVACVGEFPSGDPEGLRDALDVQAGPVQQAVGDQRGARVADGVAVGVGAGKLAAEHIPAYAHM
jgi:hypothetical protein